MADIIPIGRLALVVGGGPAPGINGVISAVSIEALNRETEVYGIEDGYKWLVSGDIMADIDKGMEFATGDDGHLSSFSKDDVKQIYSRGGSILGTSRTNPTKNPEDMARVIDALKRLKIDALVSIGGDDTAYSASQVYKHFKDTGGYLRVAHVPKTIDNDLPLPGSTPTFGFETARHYGVTTVRNLAEDARTTSRWYIVVCMGRAAGHLALGIGKAAAATITVIPEEFGLDADGKPNKISFKRLCDVLLGSIIKRQGNNKHYGVIVLAEGLIESVKEELKVILEKTHGRYGTYETDAFGHLRLGEIEFGKLVRDLLTERLSKAKDPEHDNPDQPRLHDLLQTPTDPYGLKVTFITKDLGYELRSADPIPFDAEYTRDLGYSAVKFLLSEEAMKYGAVIGFNQGIMEPTPFEKMINPKTKRMHTRLVNVKGEGYEVARRYMIRLEKRDFNDPDLIQSLADVIRASPEQFREQFSYLVS